MAHGFWWCHSRIFRVILNDLRSTNIKYTVIMMMAALVICWGPMITWNILRYFEGKMLWTFLITSWYVRHSLTHIMGHNLWRTFWPSSMICVEWFNGSQPQAFNSLIYLVPMNASLCAILNAMKSLFPWSNPILNACLYAFRVRRFRQDVKNILYKQHMERKFGSKF